MLPKWSSTLSQASCRLTARLLATYNAPMSNPPTATASPNFPRLGVGSWLLLLLAGGLLLLVGWRVADFVATSSYWLPYPFPRQGSEGLTMYEALLLRGGENIYLPLSPTRFISAPYPPLYYLLTAALLDPQRPDFAAGRLLSFGASFVAATCVGLTVYCAVGGRAGLPGRFGGAARLLAAAVAGGLFLSLPPVLVWASRYRADMVALALVAAGLAAMQARPAGWGAWLAAAAFALSFYTKQTYLAGPLGGGLYLLLLSWQGRRLGQSNAARGVTFRFALLWGCGLAALLLLPTLLLSAATRGGYWDKMVTYHNLPWEAKTFSRLLAALLENHWPLLLLAAAYLAYESYRLLKQGRQPTIARLAICLPYLLASLLLLPSGGVVGADSNHLLAVALALVLVAGEGLGRAMLAAGGSRPLSYYLPAAIVVLAIGGYLLSSATPAGWYGLDLRQPDAATQAQLARVVSNVTSNPGKDYLADEVGLLVLAGKRPAYDDLFTMTALANKRLWDESAVRAGLAGESFALVLLANAPNELRRDIMTAGMRAALQQHYYVKFADVWYTYEGNSLKPK